jgi:hypothetical protein
VLCELVDRLAKAGIKDHPGLALIRSAMSAIAAEQMANNPEGRVFDDETQRGIRALIPGARSPQA